MADQVFQGLAFFPGIEQIVSCDFTLALGRSPSAATVNCLPQRGWPPDRGDLVLRFGSNIISFREMKIDKATATRNESGQIVSLTLLDRRWRWDTGWISGRYNRRKPSGELDADTKLDARQLATKCLKLMGEAGFDVSALPPAYPEIEWDADLPAEALMQLCELYGCSLSLGLNDAIRIVKMGQGRPLPTFYVMDNAETIDPPNAPVEVGVMCAKAPIAVALELEPMAQEKTSAGQPDKFVPYNSVSYKPAGGFTFASWPHLMEVTDSNNRKLAEDSIFKVFRIKLPITLPNIPGGYIPTSIKKYSDFEIRDDRLYGPASESLAPSKTSSKQAVVIGQYSPLDVDLKNNLTAFANDPLTDAAARLKDDIDFTIFTDKSDDCKYVRLSKSIVRNSQHTGSSTPTGITIAPPRLWLLASIEVRTQKDEHKGGWVRFAYSKPVPGGDPDHAVKVEVHDEIVVGIAVKYNSSFSPTGYTTSFEDSKDELNYYVDSMLEQYRVQTPQVVRYPGLWTIEPDGAIQQVTWTISDTSGSETTACRHTEETGRTIAYKEKRWMESQTQAKKDAKKQRVETRKNRVGKRN